MEKKYNGMLSVCCYSDKVQLPIMLEIDPDLNEWSIEDIDPNCIDEGCSEYYWENHFEFEPYIARIESIRSKDKNINFNDAVFEVFGHFHLRFEVEGQIEDIKLAVDIEKIIYDLLLEDCEI